MAARAFAFQGRCLWVARARTLTRRDSEFCESSWRWTNQAVKDPSQSPRERTPEVTPGRHPQAPSRARGAHTLTQQVRGRMSSVPLRKAMALCEPRRRWPCHRDQHEQPTQNHAGLAHQTGGWKSNVDRLGAVGVWNAVHRRYRPVGTWDASGLTYL